MAAVLRGLATFGLPPFEMHLIKATYADDFAPKSKHLDLLLSCSHSNPEFNMVGALSQRLDEKEWRVVFKALIVWHHLCNQGHPSFIKAYSKQAQKTDLSGLDDTIIEKKVASRVEFLRNYAEYLTERAHSYRRLNYAVERVKLDSCKEWARQLNPSDLVTNISSLCGQLHYLLRVQPPDVLTGSVPIFAAALTLLARDSIVLFSLLSLLFLTLLDKLQYLSLPQARSMVMASDRFREQNKILLSWSVNVQRCIQTQVNFPNFSTDGIPPTFVEILNAQVRQLESEDSLPEVQVLSLDDLDRL
jgi:hypothetical protein